ncbi:Ger(x)C family spore germination protein [Bacillus sp. 165]|uniref:Ger(x)C family spore germination protein n=1 Tax=Bacillus sp. 165 TaxID=1529117 RepID=UPI001ADC313C|nr:Ger(x)C family spore germination protein [Bacillus sp. 165]MBO9128996.1 Ger(x)C family spore germination protein [Bacillus sp. 165]
MSTKLMLLFIFIFAALTGCSNYKELNELGIVVGAGIDYDPKKDVYEVVHQVINPSENNVQGSGSGATAVVSFKSSGKTLVEAARNSSKKFNRLPIYSHIALLIIGEQLAKKETLNFLFDVFERDGKVRVNIPVLIARNTDVQQLMDTLPSLGKIPMSTIVQTVDISSQLLGENGETKVFEVIQSLASEGREPAISGISIGNDKKNEITQANLETMDKAYVYLNGVGMFKKGKLVGWMDGKKTKSIQIIDNTLQETSLRIHCNEKKYNSILINRSHSRVKVDMQNNQAVISVRTHAIGTLDEMLCNKDISNDKVIKEFEYKAKQELQQEIRSGILAAQQKGSDIFGFGDVLHISHPDKWKKVKQDWNKMFAKAKIDIHVDIGIESTGMRIEPYRY